MLDIYLYVVFPKKDHYWYVTLQPHFWDAHKLVPCRNISEEKKQSWYPQLLIPFQHAGKPFSDILCRWACLSLFVTSEIVTL